MRSLVIAVLTFGLFACTSEQETPPVHPTADLVLTNGNILTVDADLPAAEAVAINGDRITAVGSVGQIFPYIGEDTEVIDLAGQTAIPGLIEGHGHYTSFGGSLLILDFRYAESWAEIVSMVEEKVPETPAGEWIIGRLAPGQMGSQRRRAGRRLANA